MKRREQSFKKAVEETKNILDEQQRQKYDQILKTRVGQAAATQPTRAH